MRTEILGFKSTITGLGADNEKIKSEWMAKYQLLTVEMKSYTEQIGQINLEKTRLIDECNRYKTQIGEFTAKIASMDANLVAVQGEYRGLQGRFGELEIQYNNYVKEAVGKFTAFEKQMLVLKQENGQIH